MDNQANLILHIRETSKNCSVIHGPFGILPADVRSCLLVVIPSIASPVPILREVHESATLKVQSHAHESMTEFGKTKIRGA